jgi:hypothetical protein
MRERDSRCKCRTLYLLPRPTITFFYFTIDYEQTFPLRRMNVITSDSLFFVATETVEPLDPSISSYKSNDVS